MPVAVEIPVEYEGYTRHAKENNTDVLYILQGSSTEHNDVGECLIRYLSRNPGEIYGFNIML